MGAFLNPQKNIMQDKDEKIEKKRWKPNSSHSDKKSIIEMTISEIVQYFSTSRNEESYKSKKLKANVQGI